MHRWTRSTVWLKARWKPRSRSAVRMAAAWRLPPWQRGPAENFEHDFSGRPVPGVRRSGFLVQLTKISFLPTKVLRCPWLEERSNTNATSVAAIAGPERAVNSSLPMTTCCALTMAWRATSANGRLVGCPGEGQSFQCWSGSAYRRAWASGMGPRRRGGGIVERFVPARLSHAFSSHCSSVS